MGHLANLQVPGGIISGNADMMGRIAIECFRKYDWRKQQIQENGEPLVQFDPAICVPQYHAQGLTTEHRLFGRETAVRMISSARKILAPKGLDLMVYDAWRSESVQTSLFWHHLAHSVAPLMGIGECFVGCDTLEAQKEAFERLDVEIETKQFLIDETRKYASWPSADPQSPYPHSTGGAIDVWLYQDGKPANLGVEFDEMVEIAGTFCHIYDHTPFSAAVRKNRQHLIDAMLDVGFSPYPFEVWHWSYGDQMWGMVQSKPALYGPAIL